MENQQTGIVTQFLTFMLDSEQYALNVTKVKEVLEYTNITKVPRTPDFMRGVINLRGGVVPVIDLRLKFGLSATENTVDTCIVVTEINYEDDILMIGALADSVQEVVEISSDNIEPPPKIGTRLNTEFIEGMGKKDDRFLILLNIEKVFSTEEIGLVAREFDGSQVEEEAVAYSEE